jgi:hypothetical protein
VNLWELDQRYLELPGREEIMLDLLYDYQNNVTPYPTWQEFLRTHRPPGGRLRPRVTGGA